MTPAAMAALWRVGKLLSISSRGRACKVELLRVLYAL